MPKTGAMCRNIKTLFNFEPPADDGEIEAAATQYVRKISGFSHPSAANETAFRTAVEEVTGASKRLLVHLQTNAAPKSREAEARKAKERALKRFANASSGTRA